MGDLARERELRGESMSYSIVFFLLIPWYDFRYMTSTS